MSLFTDISEHSILLRHVPRQIDINLILDLIQKRALNKRHLPFNVKEVRKQQLCAYLRDIYAWIISQILPGDNAQAKIVKNKVEDFIAIEGVLFHVDINKRFEDDLRLTLAVPDKLLPELIGHYHD